MSPLPTALPAACPFCLMHRLLGVGDALMSLPHLYAPPTLPVSHGFSPPPPSQVPNASPTAASASSDMYGAAILDACRQVRWGLSNSYAGGNQHRYWVQLLFCRWESSGIQCLSVDWFCIVNERSTTTPSYSALPWPQLNERLEPYRRAAAAAPPSSDSSHGHGPDDDGWAGIVNAAYMQRVDLSAHGFYLTPDVNGGYGNRPFNYYSFGASGGDWGRSRAG